MIGVRRARLYTYRPAPDLLRDLKRASFWLEHNGHERMSHLNTIINVAVAQHLRLLRKMHNKGKPFPPTKYELKRGGNGNPEE